MKRSILLSLSIIGAGVALIATAGTFAPFTDDDSEVGSVTAGNVEIDVTGTPGTALSFDPGAGGCPGTLAPGDSCVETVNVTNTGNLIVNLAAPTATKTITAAGEGTCSADDDWTVTFSGVYSDDGSLILAETESFTTTVTLDADAQTGCQGAVLEVEVTVTGSNP